jgi:hypothetical protein
MEWSEVLEESDERERLAAIVGGGRGTGCIVCIRSSGIPRMNALEVRRKEGFAYELGWILLSGRHGGCVEVADQKWQ